MQVILNFSKLLFNLTLLANIPILCNFASMKRTGSTYLWIMGLIIMVLLAGADMLCGGQTDMMVMLHLRTPRILTALLAGASLAVAGSQMQSILRNPLADPHIMGVSAGAALGAALATMSGFRLSPVLQGLTIAAAAFAGAIAAAGIILAASRRFRTAATLLVFGVMLGFIANALVSILQFSSDSESLKMFYSWSAGSFSNTGWSEICIMTAVLAIGIILAWKNAKGLDILLFGDEFAEMSGAPIRKIRYRAILSCSLLAATVTAFCGPLGFVGIVAPHIARGAFRTSAHRTILPASLLTGAATAVGADLISQASPSVLPVASTMAIVGVPIIIYILIKGNGYEG